MVEPEMVMIVWADAVEQSPGWTAIADIDLDIPIMRTVGWLIGESPSAYAIAQDVDLEESNVHTFGLIPKGMVLSIDRLVIRPGQAGIQPSPST